VTPISIPVHVGNSGSLAEDDPNKQIERERSRGRRDWIGRVSRSLSGTADKTILVIVHGRTVEQEKRSAAPAME